MIILASAIAAMSAVDLYLTLLYLTHAGMSEANPFARAVIELQSPQVLALWKALTVSLSLGIFYLVRHTRSAELGAWIGVTVLGVLMTHWVHYINHTTTLRADHPAVAVQMDSAWVSLDPDARRVIP